MRRRRAPGQFPAGSEQLVGEDQRQHGEADEPEQKAGIGDPFQAAAQRARCSVRIEPQEASALNRNRAPTTRRTRRPGAPRSWSPGSSRGSVVQMPSIVPAIGRMWCGNVPGSTRALSWSPLSSTNCVSLQLRTRVPRPQFRHANREDVPSRSASTLANKPPKAYVSSSTFGRTTGPHFAHARRTLRSSLQKSASRGTGRVCVARPLLRHSAKEYPHDHGYREILQRHQGLRIHPA